MATAILGILITPIVEVAKCLITPLQLRISYTLNCYENLNHLKAEFAELTKTSNSIKKSMDEARRRGEDASDEVKRWLEKVDDTESDLLIMNGYLGEAKQGCSNTCNLTLRTRYMIGKTATDRAKVVFELQRDARFITVSKSAPPPSIEMMPSGDFKVFESTRLTMMKIITALSQEENRIIGIYGMGGVGKTSLIKEVAKQAKSSKMFDEVVIATVSQNPDLHKIQSEIAESLGLNLVESSDSIRALRLAARLKHEARLLLILDDVWERLELARLGIPSGEDHSGCRVAITTRSLDVCGEMDTNANIVVETLMENESWDLFKKVAGNVVETPDLQDAAKKVAQECGGLPIALVTLGRVLRYKERTVWVNAAKALQVSRPVNIKGMHEKVFSCLQLSFDQVKTEEEKLCYLYCCLFPEDYDVRIEDLVRYGIGEALFSDMETVDEARNRVHTIVSNLKASTLLLRSDKDGCVKMHDVFRDLAISIATGNDYSFMVKASSGLKEWPRKGYAMRMSLIDNDIYQLPSDRNHPELVLLLLQKNHKLRVIPDDFFEGIPALQVLDLSDIPNSFKLPMTLSCLTNLKTLYIENNDIEDLSVLGELRSLEILSLQKSSFALLPAQLGRLTNLRLLDLTESQIREIPSNVISGLSQLEELYAWGSYSDWEVEESQSEGRATLSEILSLEHLNTLHIHISKSRSLMKDITRSCQDLKRYHIQIGEKFNWEPKSRTSICFNIPDEEKLQKPIADWNMVLVEAVDELFLTQWKELQSLELLHAEGFSSVKSLCIQRCGLQNGVPSSWLDRMIHLRELSISSCPSLGEVFLSNSSNPVTEVLPRLTRMHLQDLPRLETIWRGVVPSLCFQSLTSIRVIDCNRLKIMFTDAITKTLKQLEILEVSNCDDMEILISRKGDHTADPANQKINLSSLRSYPLESTDTEIVFPRLRNLKLMHLRNIITLTEPRVILDCPSLEQLTVASCPRLMKLPFDPKTLPNLKIKAERKWLEKLERENGGMRLQMQEHLKDS
ncbi:hypothetical protein Droror1_Dr00018975 [Drosera rotundifolia]